MMKSVSARSVVPVATAVSMTVLWGLFILQVAGIMSVSLLALLSLVMALWVFTGTRTPVAMSEALVAALPRARLHVLHDAAHIGPLEQPAAFAQALRDFLGELGAGSANIGEPS